MSGPRKLPDNDVLWAIHLHGVSHAPIAHVFGTSRQAVTLRLRDSKPPAVRLHDTRCRLRAALAFADETGRPLPTVDECDAGGLAALALGEAECTCARSPEVTR